MQLKNMLFKCSLKFWPPNAVWKYDLQMQLYDLQMQFEIMSSKCSFKLWPLYEVRKYDF